MKLDKYGGTLYTETFCSRLHLSGIILNIIITVVPIGLGLVIISAMVTSTFAPQPVFSQPTNATNATATHSILSSHVGGMTCVYSNIEYSPGSTIVMGNTGVKTCQTDGSWRLGSHITNGRTNFDLPAP